MMPSISRFVRPASSIASFMATAKSEMESMSGTSPMGLCPTPTMAYLSFKFVATRSPPLYGTEYAPQGNGGHPHRGAPTKFYRRRKIAFSDQLSAISYQLSAPDFWV